MSSFWRPRRGKKSTAIAQLTGTGVLKRGEVFFEVPDAGVGAGEGKIKMGDGGSAYDELPYFLSVPDSKIGFTNTSTPDATLNPTCLNAISPSNNLTTILTNLKQLLVNFNYQITNSTGQFIGTLAEWNALTDAQKAQYRLVSITDDGGGASGGAEPTEITYADFMELTTEEQEAGYWLVTDMPGTINASVIPYSGDVSGVTNVADAIDALAGDVDTLNQNLTLNYTDSSLPSSTTFNEFAQMVLERLYPKTVNFNTMTGGFITTPTTGVSYAFNPIRVTYASQPAYTTAIIETNDYYDLTNYEGLTLGCIAKITGGNQDNVVDIVVELKSRNGTTTQLLAWNPNATGIVTKTANLTSFEGEYKIKVSLGSGGRTVTVTQFTLQ